MGSDWVISHTAKNLSTTMVVVPLRCTGGGEVLLYTGSNVLASLNVTPRTNIIDILCSRL